MRGEFSSPWTTNTELPREVFGRLGAKSPDWRVGYGSLAADPPRSGLAVGRPQDSWGSMDPSRLPSFNMAEYILTGAFQDLFRG